ncbi:hypothetical protein [Candidatus Tisiphia endosymbiont of Nemotelus uliginosus]|uniref:hypothetical protein n=1 Tax=Candidatus Tisiphia endosymbiont of Nemotelus uliginosus TaxID=3077926 RepID=UPI0035C90EC3
MWGYLKHYWCNLRAKKKLEAKLLQSIINKDDVTDMVSHIVNGADPNQIITDHSITIPPGTQFLRGVTPLQLAIAQQSPLYIQALLDNGAIANKANSPSLTSALQNITQLYVAIIALYDIAVITHYIGGDSNIKSLITINNIILLNASAVISTVMLLLDLIPNITLPIICKANVIMPIELALQTVEHKETIVRILLEYGADQNLVRDQALLHSNLSNATKKHLQIAKEIKYIMDLTNNHNVLATATAITQFKDFYTLLKDRDKEFANKLFAYYKDIKCHDNVEQYEINPYMAGFLSVGNIIDMTGTTLNIS